MKKLLTAIISIAVCAISATSLVANADYLVVENDELNAKYVEWNELTDYIGYTKGSIYRTVDKNDNNEYSYIYSSYYSNSLGSGVSYSTFSISFGVYGLSDDTKTKLTEFLETNYPTMELVSMELPSNRGYQINYNDALTIDEELELAIDIKNNLGITCSHAAYEDVLNVTVIEETTTTTTTTASETTTTTTTTAAASSTTAKKGVDSPKTGDAGLAGVLLAGAGAVAMAFALRKRED